jgi:hypothetical protein
MKAVSIIFRGQKISVGNGAHRRDAETSQRFAEEKKREGEKEGRREIVSVPPSLFPSFSFSQNSLRTSAQPLRLCGEKRLRNIPLAFAIMLFVLLSSVSSFAQKQRPKILPRAQQQFAGRLLLIPRDARPVSWKLPRLIARVAAYEIVVPPRELLGDGTQPLDPDRLVDWVKTQDITRLHGALVALDTLAGWTREASAEQIKQRLELLNWLRQRKPELPIYGFAQKSHPALSAFVFDDLSLEAPEPDVAHLLVAKFLQRAHQRPIKVLTITSSTYAPPMLKALTGSIDAVGAQLMSSGKADIFLFVHTPNTDAIQLANFATTLANTVTAGYYVALADVSGNAAPLIAALRERKQLDLLQAYAAAPNPHQALGQAVAHCAARLIAAKVLRPSLEVEQLQRAERAQVELMLTRYLEDWGYAETIRARVEQHVRNELKAEPMRLATATEQAEAFANTELKLLAQELFRTQFRYNLHSVLLGSGVRADFQVEMLQLFKARFPLERIDVLELDLSIYLSLLVGINPRPLIKSP